MSDKPLSRLTYSIPEVAELLDIGRNAAYDAAKSGQIAGIPIIRVGKRMLVPSAPFDRLLETGSAA
jgi:excisionase family DNA binding protein